VMFVARRMNWYDLALGSVTCERRPRSGVE
jgi:hypothetical protein